MLLTRGSKQITKPAVRAISTRLDDQKTQASMPTSWAGNFTTAQMKKMQMDDTDIGPIIIWLSDGEKPSSAHMSKKNPCIRHYWNLWSSLVMKEGLLFRKFHRRDSTDEYLQFIVPQAMKKDILHQMHDSLMSGHLGCMKTREKILQKFYWFGLRDDVNIYIQRCDNCAANKESRSRPRAPLGSMPVGAPLDRLSTDILRPLPITPRNNRYILIVVDYFTKWVEVFPVPDQTARTCADIIANEVIARFGALLDLHSDQGRNFESDIFKELCVLLEVRKTRTSPRNPKCNGLVERFNKTILRMIKAYLRVEQTNWDLNLGCLAAAYRSTPQESTGLTPNMLMLGREVRLPVEIMLGSLTSDMEPITRYGDYVESLRFKLKHAHDVCRKHLERSAYKQKTNYDVKQNLVIYQPGDQVWVLKESRKEHISPKLQAAFEGPYVVAEKLSKLDYRVYKDKDGRRSVVLHHDKLKPYRGQHTPQWTRKFIKSHSQ